MAWTTPITTFAVHDILTAAEMNAIGANLNVLNPTWTTYTPTWGNITMGNAVISARYQRINTGAGGTVNFVVSATMGSTTTFGSGWNMTLPAALQGSYEYRFKVGMRDVSAGQQWEGTTYGTSGSVINLATLNTGGGITIGLTPTNPFAWAITDVLTIVGMYEAA